MLSDMLRHLRRALFLVSVCFLSFASCHAADTTTTMRVGEEIWQVQYGEENGRLRYLVFDGPKELPYSNIVKIGNSSSHRVVDKEGSVEKVWEKKSAIFKYPDGRKVELAGTGRILFVTKGKVTEVKLNLAPNVLEEFIRSKPQSVTPEALKKFAATKARSSSKGE